MPSEKDKKQQLGCQKGGKGLWFKAPLGFFLFCSFWFALVFDCFVAFS